MRGTSIVLPGLILTLIISITACTPKDEIFYTGTHGGGIIKYDRSFVTGEASRCYSEIAFGKLALSKTNDVHIQAYAGVITKDHTDIQYDLQKYVSLYWPSVTLPTGIDSLSLLALNQMAQLSGYSFDTAYMKRESMVNGYKVQSFYLEAQEGAIVQFANLATKWFPRVMLHQKLSDSLLLQLTK